jgi:hypothetical protein
VQPGDRRRGQGPPGQGDRRARRGDGPGHRRHRHPVPAAQRVEGPGGTLDAGPGRQAPLPRGDAGAARGRARRGAAPGRGREHRHRRRAGRAAAGGRRHHHDGRALPRPRGRHHHRHLPARGDLRRRRPRRRRPGRRGAVAVAVGLAGAAGPAAGAAQDRHAVPHRRQDHRLRGARAAAGRRAAAAVRARSRRRAAAAAAAALLDHLHHRRDPRPHPRQPAPLAVVPGRDRGRRPALLPVDRGQGRPVRGQGAPPDLPGARVHRQLRSRRDLSQRHLDLVALRRAAGAGAIDPRPRAGRDDPARLRGRVRLRRPARAVPDARDPARRGAVPGRADQRHVGLRGGGDPGAARRRQRGAGAGRARAAGAVAGRRPTAACWSTIWSPAAPRSRTG